MAGLAAGLGHVVRRLEGSRFPGLRGGSRLPWTAARRALCGKPPEGSSSAQKPEAAGSSFRVPGHKPSDWDKRFLLWTGRFKKAEDIPETVSFEMVDAARNKMRVKISYLMIVMTILGCITMVVIGKRGVERHESLTSLNLAKKARWREEAAQSVSAKP